ncbi:GIP [Symbiodinium microadriaticum]|nr:GIP [Symbiodinium sp. KB8]CAE7861159.1 GIP [Symbiodinium microadriaticum]
MSAQPGSEALLREHQGDRSGEVEPGAEDTGAVLSDAAYSAASGAPQMNGTAGGGLVVGPDGAAVAEGVKDDIAGCPAEASEPQRMQTRTDEGDCWSMDDFVDLKSQELVWMAGEGRSTGQEDSATNAILEALTKNLVGLQELQLKSLRRETDPDDAPEQVKSSNISLPMLASPDEATAGILFQDWVAQISVPMQDLSATSSTWWKDVMELVQITYSKWLSANPLERLQLEPVGHERLISSKWTRVNSRACTLILQCLVESVKSDLIARRVVQSMPMIMFRLHTCYQPGGANERSTVLTNLQSPTPPTSLEGSLNLLRAWPRWLQRCKDLNMMVPDATVLARALTMATSKFISENADAQFRTQLLRSSLRIDSQPALEDVVKYQRHLQAEVESMMSSRATTPSNPVSVKALGTGTSATPSTTASQKPQCKYFIKQSGCRRGQKCPYTHDWSAFTKTERAKRCLACGSEEHRQKDCPSKTQKPPARASGSNPTSPSATPSAGDQSSGGEAVWTLDSLIQAAAKEEAMGRSKGHRLLCWIQASPVTVNLAGGEAVSLKMNSGGTILVPISSSTAAGSSSPIVPLGALVGQLGYTMVWGNTKCRLEGRNGDVINLRVRDGCPELMEQEALRLIGQLEDARLRELRCNTQDTRRRVKAAALAMDRTWFDHLLSYVDSGFTSEAYKALESAPFLEGVPKECVSGMFDAVPESNGWDILRGLKHLNRKARKRLWSSKSWVVHLFAGDRKKPELYHLEGHGHVVLELDIERGKTQNVLSPGVWRVLEWGARQGKISGVIGGPPQGSFMISRHVVGGPEPLRSNDYPYGGWQGQSDGDLYTVNKHTSLYVRMIMLHALSTAGRIRHPSDPGHPREVAFMLEQPRDPRGYLKFQDPLFDDVVSFWRTPLWSEYALEAGLHTYSFDMAAFGKSFTRFTTVGTNLPLQHIQGLRFRAHVDGPVPERSPPRVWPTEFLEQVTIALRNWFAVPRMLRMSAEQWREHVQRGHLPFRADCAVCVQAGATGRRHSRVEHPSAFVLSADLSGPVKIGGTDPDARGIHPRKYKYLFAAKLRIPKSFAEDGRGGWVSYDKGELKLEEYDDKDDGLAPEAALPGAGVGDDLPADEEGEEEPPFKEHARRDHDLDPDLSAPELVNLIFSCGLKDDKATSVLEAIQDVVLYCRSLNIPILRFHSDRGMEFRARATVQWLKGEGIRVTTSEAGVHQTSGAAEATVRWLKQRARTLLLSADLPQHLWPAAVSTAASMQRGDVLGFEPTLAAPFGAKVLVRKRQLEGPKLEDLAPKWVSGKYVGLSDSLSKGHLVYVKDEEGERFIHTLHVRAGLHDPGPVPGEFEAPLPDPPERRVRGKSAGSGDVVGVSKAQVFHDTDYHLKAEELLREWSQEEAEALILEVARILPDDERNYGMFRHGGKLGVTRATVERPWLARVINRVFRERVPDAEYAALFVSVNNEREVHVDRNNAVGAVNHLLPLSMPRRGGELWMELRDGDVVSGKVLELTSKEGRVRYGCAYSLQEGRVFSFDPHRRHAVLPWKGERVVVVGYTPGLLAALKREDREILWDLQFPLPLDENDVPAPEIYINALSVKNVVVNKDVEQEVNPIRGGGWSEVIPTSDGDFLFKCDWSVSKSSPSPTAVPHHSNEQDIGCEEWEDWEMRLVLDEGEAKASTAAVCPGGRPLVCKTEVAYTRGIEELLCGLAAPLSIVHTVDPVEAASNLEQWLPAIRKEAGSLEHAVIRVAEDDELVRADVDSGKADVIPMKLVFTVKPPDSDSPDYYKRKARIVVCGNLATHKPEDVYASTAPAEIVRAAIALANYFGWDLGMIDIVAAFLQTPLHAVKNAPLVYGRPPKVLVKAGICARGELWKLTHAVYGLQESPRLWSAYRDEQLGQLQLVVGGKRIVLQQGRVESSWWKVLEEEGSVLIGLLVVYVDDILICGHTSLIRELAEAIRKLWRTSPLQLVGEGELRFLGIEIARTTYGFALSQNSYIEELLRIHSTSAKRRDLVPLSKDQASFIALEEEVPQGEAEIRSAQQVAGELLWISQRSRPDISFVCSLIGSLSTRAPRRAVEIGEKTLAFLQSSLIGLVDDEELDIRGDSQGIKWVAWVIYDKASPGEIHPVLIVTKGQGRDQDLRRAVTLTVKNSYNC